MKGTLGEGVEYELTKAGKLTIVIDTSKNFGKSKSEKTFNIASTRGAKNIDTDRDGGCFLNINCYQYVEAKKE